MQRHRFLILACVAAFAVGYLFSNSCHGDHHGNRPVARFFSRVARSLLWVALAAEKPPAEPQPDHRYAQHAIGEDGYPRLDNARGW